MLEVKRELQSRIVETSRLRCHMLECGDPTGIPLVFIHGNFSSSVYFEEFMLGMPMGYRCLAVDLRGYGKTQDLPIDATRGARDWSDDLFALLSQLGIAQAHLLGWSAGAAAVLQFALDHGPMVLSLTLFAPVSPYGFGGSKTVTGTPCYGDFSGSGGGLVNAEFVERITHGDRTTESPFSPLSIMRNALVNPPFRFERESALLEGSLEQKTGSRRYPGDACASPHWPYQSPGAWGPLNAVSAKYLDLSGVADIQDKPPILWVRGDKDSVVSDGSLSDPGVLGEMQLIPAWPGRDVYPPQPMISQTRFVLNAYRKNGGHYREIVLPDVGHSPFLENPDDVLRHLLQFFSENARQ